MAGRTFSQLKEKKSPRDLNRLCKQIAEEYANTELEKATTYFTEKYNISKSCYEKIKDYAVTRFLVSDKTAQKMMEKAKANQMRSSSSSGKSTYDHYADLFAQRRQYVFDLAKEYAECTQTPVNDLLDKHGRDYEGYIFMIKKAFTGNYGITFEMAKQIQIRMLQEAKTGSECARICEYFGNLWQERSSKPGMTTL